MRGDEATLNMLNCHQQIGDKDCGVFAIANAYALCSGEAAGKLVYNVAQMREQCNQSAKEHLENYNINETDDKCSP